jgi:glyoxylate/hydroxypyruvate reductase
MSVLYTSDPVRGETWAATFAEHAPDVPFHVGLEGVDLAQVEYLVAWRVDPALLARLPRLKVLFSVGAGVDQLGLAALPPQLPIVRMIESGIITGMAEYLALAVLMLHRQVPEYLAQQARREWRPHSVVPAARRRVGIMGLGVLGEAALRQLAPFGFALRGWSRSPHALEGVQGFHGAAQLPAFLAGCDILACLLPLTDDTRGLLDARLFAALPRGACVVNAARGGLLREHDLLAALDSGQLSAAVLDVTDPEPLPVASALWNHPKVILTPHVAAETRPGTAALAVIENIRRHGRGEPLHGLIDRGQGY